MMRRLFLVFLSLSSLLFLFSPIAFAAENKDGETLPDAYKDLLSSLPPSILERLPEGALSSKAEEVGGAVGEMSSFSYLLQTVLSLVGLRLGDCLGILCSIVGILILSSICRTFATSLKKPEIARAFSLLMTLIITVTIFAAGFGTIEATVSYFHTLNAFTSASVPLMGGLYVMGGNAAAAVATSAGLSLFMTVLEEIVGGSIVPFCGICLALSLIGACEGGPRLGGILTSLKKNYTLMLSFFMMLLLAMLSSQTVLGASQDTLAMRSAKFAAGSFIPVVGGSVGELLRSVSASVGYMRSAVGICGVLLLLLLMLPTLVELLLARTTWQICSFFAELLGCDGEKRLLDEFASINGYLIAAVAICSSVLFLTFTLLTHCAVALA
jgi:stage III sporulation protein AE